MGPTTLKRFRKILGVVKTLFTNPYDEEVELMHSTLSQSKVHFRLRSAPQFHPGKLDNARLPQSPYKVMSGQLA